MIETVVRPATLADLPAIDALRKADGDALGFIPLQCYEYIVEKKSRNGRLRFLHETLLVCSDNDDLTGFVFASFWRRGTKVDQICVRRDARMVERATKLLDAIESEAWRRGSPKVKCRVAHDIEANVFWKARQFNPIATVTSTFLNVRESVCKRPLIHYEKPLCQLELF